MRRCEVRFTEGKRHHDAGPTAPGYWTRGWSPSSFARRLQDFVKQRRRARRQLHARHLLTWSLRSTPEQDRFVTYTLHLDKRLVTREKSRAREQAKRLRKQQKKRDRSILALVKDAPVIEYGHWIEQLPVSPGEGSCSKRTDGIHCHHWWDGDQPCCTCGHNDPSPARNP